MSIRPVARPKAVAVSEIAWVEERSTPMAAAVAAPVRATPLLAELRQRLNQKSALM